MWVNIWTCSQVCGLSVHVLFNAHSQTLYLCCSIASSSDYASQMLYPEALSNFELQRVLQFLVPIIHGYGTKYSLHIRILAAWATMGQATLQPDQVCCSVSEHRAVDPLGAHFIIFCLCF
jgi:hypothetical protein